MNLERLGARVRAVRVFSALGSGFNEPGVERLDVEFWSKNIGKAHPADRPLEQQFVAAKSACRDAMAAYLAAYGVDED